MHIHLLLLACTLTLLTACGEPETPVNQARPASVTGLPKLPLQNEDPYFVPSDTSVSSYGPRSITRSILSVPGGPVWLATWQGIIRYENDTFVNLTRSENLRPFHVFGLFTDQQQHLWATTIGAGVYRYDGEDFVNFTTREGLPNDRVTYGYTDREGIIWFGTEGGLSRYEDGEFRNFTAAEGLPDNDVNAIIQDKNGQYWIGTRGPAATFDGQDFTLLRTPDGKPFTNVRTILEDPNGNLWIGGNDGLWRYDGKSFSRHDQRFVGYLYLDRAGNLWAGTAGQSGPNWTLERYAAASLNGPELSATTLAPEIGMLFGIEEDQQGHIWFGTLNGVGRYDGERFNYFRE